jgi:hypothetical protein
MDLRHCGLEVNVSLTGKCKATKEKYVLRSQSLPWERSTFKIAHIDPAPQDVGTSHRARMGRGASLVATTGMPRVRRSSRAIISASPSTPIT